MMLKLLAIFILGVAELWAAAPAGVLMGFNPFLVCLVAAGGAVSGGVVVILLGERVRLWLSRRRQKSGAEKKKKLIDRIWQRYGVIGWGLLAPVLVGPPLGAAFGLVFGAPARRLMLWLSLGSILWSIVFSTVTGLGLHIFGNR